MYACVCCFDPAQVHVSILLFRSVRDLIDFYKCGPSLSALESYRQSCGLPSIARKCFEAANISAVLIDDGIKFDKMHNWEWHNGFVPAVGRILRIEHEAETILNEETYDLSTWTIKSFTEIFLRRIKSYPFFADKVVSLKSIAACRSGLQIDTEVSWRAAEEGLLADLNSGRPVRIRNKSFIDYLFTRSLEAAVTFGLPMQIHTGFGDKGMDLRLCNPLHLRGVLEDKRFAKCRIVLLHASYPFSKEASYLASVYRQVYLDFGLAVPKLSTQGMISSVKELLELAPIKKVMFSTDGYAFPETFYLGAKKAREVVFSVLSGACDDGDLTISEAVEAVEDIFRQNSLRFYNMNHVIGSISCKNSEPGKSESRFTPSDDIVFVRLMWIDTSGQHRCRVIPAKRFYEVVKNNGVGLTIVSMGMPSFTDAPADGTNLTAVGEIRLVPDLSTKHTIPWTKHEEIVLGDMYTQAGEPWEYCPRDTLRRVAKIMKDEFNLVVNAGFENEFYLLKNVIRQYLVLYLSTMIIFRDGKEQWAPFDLTPYCTSSAFDSASSILQEVNFCLRTLEISVEQLHAESGKGQFEIVLGHKACTLSADHLAFTREVIRSVARKHGLLATFVPKYSLDDYGSGSHVHLSLGKDGKNVFMGSESSKTEHGMSEIGEKFMAGIFHHLPSILAFIAPLPNSYDRIQPNTWCGAYYCWGKDNKEAPIRTSSPPGVSSDVVTNFEMKSFDGCANPHLGLASIVAAGIDGLRRNLTLPKPIGMTFFSVNASFINPILNFFLGLIRSEDFYNCRS
ncbi:putative glutamine synthetase [Dioscorea sansibarensis]